MWPTPGRLSRRGGGDAKGFLARVAVAIIAGTQTTWPLWENHVRPHLLSGSTLSLKRPLILTWTFIEKLSQSSSVTFVWPIHKIDIMRCLYV